MPGHCGCSKRTTRQGQQLSRRALSRKRAGQQPAARGRVSTAGDSGDCRADSQGPDGERLLLVRVQHRVQLRQPPPAVWN
eukprot:3372784-Rhodomonas_salina.4